MCLMAFGAAISQTGKTAGIVLNSGILQFVTSLLGLVIFKFVKNEDVSEFIKPFLYVSVVSVIPFLITHNIVLYTLNYVAVSVLSPFVALYLYGKYETISDDKLNYNHFFNVIQYANIEHVRPKFGEGYTTESIELYNYIMLSAKDTFELADKNDKINNLQELITLTEEEIIKKYTVLWEKDSEDHSKKINDVNKELEDKIEESKKNLKILLKEN